MRSNSFIQHYMMCWNPAVSLHLCLQHCSLSETLSLTQLYKLEKTYILDVLVFTFLTERKKTTALRAGKQEEKDKRNVDGTEENHRDRTWKEQRTHQKSMCYVTG